MEELQPIILLIVSGLLLRFSLTLTGQAWAKSHAQTVTFMVLPIITYVITKTISGNIALSLGMIGALSIVRFRNPVKSPFELVMFFGLLTLGIVCSVSLTLAFLLSCLIIIVIFGIKISDKIFSKFGMNIFQYSFGDGNLNYTIELNTKKEVDNFLKDKNIINFYFDKEKKIFSYRLVFKSKKELLDFEKSIKNNPEIINVRADMQS